MFFYEKTNFDIFHKGFVQFVHSIFYYNGKRIENILRAAQFF